LARHIGDAVEKDGRLRGFRLRKMTIRVFLTEAGAFRHVELAASTGDQKLDETLKSVFEALPPMPDPPPKTLSQPIVATVTPIGGPAG
jgi:hypothetical protein